MIVGDGGRQVLQLEIWGGRIVTGHRRWRLPNGCRRHRGHDDEHEGKT